MEQKNKNVRLIGLDLDGTTLTSEKVLTPHTKEVLEKCLAEGIQVLPATGRVKTGIPEYLTQIEGMRYVILSMCSVLWAFFPISRSFYDVFSFSP